MGRDARLRCLVPASLSHTTDPQLSSPPPIPQDIVSGTFKGFALLRQQAHGRADQRPAYLAGYGLVPPAQVRVARRTWERGVEAVKRGLKLARGPQLTAARPESNASPRVFPTQTKQAGPPEPRPLPPRDAIWGGGGLSDGYTRAEVS